MINLPPLQLDESWCHALKEEWSAPYLQNLAHFLASERKGALPIYPSSDRVFAALNATPFDKVKVVIIGQDPYHGPGQAHGLCFSVPCGIEIPPSLRNIHKEIYDDLGIMPPKHGSLTGWAEQGVLLLNSVLTVRAHQAASHANRGWETFTNKIVKLLAKREDPLIFVLWGRYAIEKGKSCFKEKNGDHLIFTAPHPSPLSAYKGFLGCRHFSKINQELTRLGKEEIDWSQYESGN